MDEQRTHVCGRVLTDDEKTKLESDVQLVSSFTQNKLEKEAKKNWDLFYKRNETRFFKDRHWTTREFEELVDYKCDGCRPTMLEVGAGVGNFFFPLIREGTKFYIFACDFSPVAVNLIKANCLYDESNACKAFVSDITSEQFVADFRNCCGESNVDVITLMFVLSAINPNKMFTAVTNLFSVLKPGGIVLFRDYGLYDYAMLRFNKGQKLSENFYVRQDGTRAYYFSEEFLSSLFEKARFEVVCSRYVFKETVNKKEGVCVPRVFLQSKFRKPFL